MKYKKITNEDLLYFKNIFGEERVISENEIKSEYAHDELGTVFNYPEVLVKATHKKEISALMKYANLHKIPVTVRGSGTGLVGACVPIYGGVLLDLTLMNKIIELDKTNLTLTVEPGVLIMDIYEYVLKEDLFYGPDPGEKSATIGGTVSTNAGGMRAVKYGVTRDWVRGLEVVLASGEIIKLGGKVVKNASGYSLKDLLIGSEGTLGIVTEIILKLTVKPVKMISLLAPFNSKEEAILAAPKLISNHVIPTAVEFFLNDSLLYSEKYLGKKIPHNNYPAYLLLSYDGYHEEVVDKDVRKASEMLINEFNAIDVFLIDTEERRKAIWSVRDGFLEAIKLSTTLIDECDVVLPRAKINEFLTYVDNLSGELKVRIPYFGHLGDGNLHIYFCKDDLDEKKWQETLKRGFLKLYDKAASFGGLVSGEHGIGFAKKEYLKNQLKSEQLTIMRAIKKAFDPHEILNPGKVI